MEDRVEVMIHMSGKTRGGMSVPRDAEQAVVAEAQEDAGVRRFTKARKYGRWCTYRIVLLNLVVGLLFL